MKKYMFTAKWCSNCEVMKPIVSERKDVQIIDIEDHPEYTERFLIMSLPTYVVETKDGFDSESGIRDKVTVEKFYG